jgi:tetratricopeptide (TPR) repeat protein
MRLSAGDVRAALERAAGLRRAGRLTEAAALCRGVLKSERRHPGALQLLGVLALDVRDAAAAIDLLAKAARVAPADAMIRADLGRAYVAAGRLAEAEQALRAAIAMDPALTYARCGLGYALLCQGKDAAAAETLESVLRLDPGVGMAHFYLGLVRQGQRRFAEAESFHRAALALEPDSDMVRYNLGASLHEQGRYQEALACYDAVLDRNPGHSGARLNRALVHLLRGEIGAAWEDYVARPSRSTIQARHPEWRLVSRLPPALDGRTVLLVREQGLGDELFFLRYAPALKSRGVRIRYRASAKLVSILRRSPVFDEVNEDATPGPDDYVLPVGDLPLALGGGDGVPPPLQLHARTEPVAALRLRLEAAGPRPWLGIAWRAGTALGEQSGDLHKTVLKEIPPGQFGGALVYWPGTVFVLQRATRAGEIAELEHALGRTAHDCSAVNDDLEEMLALLSLLDEYAGVSSTNVHLRAGLGMRGRILVPGPPEWRWLAAGGSTPWFPGYRVFRQGWQGDWAEALIAFGKSLRVPFPHI